MHCQMESKGYMLMYKYELGRLLGQGTFAKVYFAKNIENGRSVAIKVIDKEKVMKVGLVDQIKREICVMRLVKHPNIVQLYEVIATKSKIYFVMEYAKGGELFNKVAKGKLKEDVGRKYFQQLISAVDFCHSRGVYHRDLKPENLLLDEIGNLKVSDFGLSALAESKGQDGLLHTTCGTPAYVAPEVISRKGYDGTKADVWSCGVILFVLLAGYLPFHDSNLIEMYKKIEKAEYKCPSWFPSDVKRLLSKILEPDPNNRISTSRIMENSWFKKGLDTNLVKEEVQRKGKMAVSDSYKVVGICESSSHASDEATKSGTSNMLNTHENTKIASLNAFDIIALSPGFDLSNLFEHNNEKKEARFTSKLPAAAIISKLEDIAKHLRFKLTKKGDGLLTLEGIKPGRKGVVSIDAKIFELAPSFHLVEVNKTNGDTMEYGQLWKQDIRPSLSDIVCTWLRENQ